MVILLSPLCDAHLVLKNEKVGERLVEIMDVAKVRNADQSTGNIVSFDIEPGMGMKIIPMSKAKAWTMACGKSMILLAGNSREVLHQSAHRSGHGGPASGGSVRRKCYFHAN